jgi:hypothetical protein
MSTNALLSPFTVCLVTILKLRGNQPTRKEGLSIVAKTIPILRDRTLILWKPFTRKTAMTLSTQMRSIQKRNSHLQEIQLWSHA